MTSTSTTSGKSRLANGESDTAAYLSPQGLSRDCWPRLGEHLKVVFGTADVAEEKESAEEYETGSTEKKVLRSALMISAVSLTRCAFTSCFFLK